MCTLGRCDCGGKGSAATYHLCWELESLGACFPLTEDLNTTFPIGKK